MPVQGCLFRFLLKIYTMCYWHQAVRHYRLTHQVSNVVSVHVYKD